MARTGRPRAFDRDEALHTAMLVFWERGYATTSTSDLSAAMGINPPSLYAAFTNKENLFLEAIGLYERMEATASRQVMAGATTAFEAVAALLHDSVERFTADDRPRGCMLVHAANHPPEHESVRDFAVRCRAGTKATIRTRLEAAVGSGELAADTDTDRIAAFYTTFLNGLSVQARDGADRQHLHGLVELAMSAWPGAVGTPAGTASRGAWRAPAAT